MMNKIFIKIHESYRKVVALCDSEVIGRVFEEGKKQLDVRENFYNGREIDSDEAVELMKDLAMEDATFNIVGKNSVDAAIKAKLIRKEDYLEVQGIPFTLILV